MVNLHELWCRFALDLILWALCFFFFLFSHHVVIVSQ